MDYSIIASALEEISSAPRPEKADLVVPLLTSLDKDSICQSVRLIMGDLWPVWRSREMGIGPQMIISALEDLSSLDVNGLMRKLGEIGIVAEIALERKTQQSLYHDSLSVREIYDGLIRISEQRGDLADARKMAILRGLFLRANPQEAKYISRAIIRDMLIGIGPQTMILAISKAFDADLCRVKSAYSLMPDIGALALEASLGRLNEIRAVPSVPLKPMVIRPGKRSLPRAFLFRYPGLKVQVHSLDGELFVYTARLRNITPSLTSLSDSFTEIGRDFIAEADLVGFQKGLMVNQDELVRYVNRRHCTRRVSITPALLASDLLFLDGDDLTGHKYSKRREALASLLEGHEISGQPKSGIAISEAKVFQDLNDLEEMYRQSISMGFGGLVSRDLDAPYFPGTWSRHDAIIREEDEPINAVIIGAQYGTGQRSGTIVSYRIALRGDDVFVHAGWVSSGLNDGQGDALAKEVQEISAPGEGDIVDVEPRIVIKVKMAGARHNDGYSLIRPRIEEWARKATAEDVSGINTLEEICIRP